MDSNTLLVIGVDGGLILFFFYALYVVNQYPSSGKLKVSAKVKPERTFAITQLEPDLSSIARAQSEPMPEPEPIPDLSSFLEPEPMPEPEPIPDLSSFLEPEPMPEPRSLALVCSFQFAISLMNY
jgi:hypothetical protein